MPFAWGGRLPSRECLSRSGYKQERKKTICLLKYAWVGVGVGVVVVGVVVVVVVAGVVAGDGASAGGGSDVELHFTKTQHTLTVMDLNPNYKWISDEQNAGKTESLCLTDKLFSPDLRRERHILQQQFKEKQHFQWWSSDILPVKMYYRTTPATNRMLQSLMLQIFQHVYSVDLRVLFNTLSPPENPENHGKKKRTPTNGSTDFRFWTILTAVCWKEIKSTTGFHVIPFEKIIIWNPKGSDLTTTLRYDFRFCFQQVSRTV